ncbi:hypothetical protein HBI29_132450 [Parastagonospora nodorum]|nr:hypothetical protein HBI29_132450 [Parastagonospora nodorum]KAH5773392.1 hypothetical protein HBI16_105370 [Parastagonospora nodorum]
MYPHVTQAHQYCIAPILQYRNIALELPGSPRLNLSTISSLGKSHQPSIMSNILRLLRTSRPSNPLHTLRSSRPTLSRPTSRPSNYFSPSHSPSPFPRSRPYSSYTDPSSQISSNLTTLYALMGLNIAVFSYGAYAQAQAKQGFPAPYTKFMRNMSCNLTDVLHNNAYHTLLTSTFTHFNLFHLAANMFTTYYLGQFLCYAPVITPGRLLTIAIGAGLTGSVGYLWQRYLSTGAKGVDYRRGVGFSGALMGVISVAACLAPSAKVQLYGIVPVPLWALVVGYAAYDGYYLNDNNSRIAHSGHLGGLAFGLAYYVLRLRGLRGMRY